MSSVGSRSFSWAKSKEVGSEEGKTGEGVKVEI
jgi:hypothetical protein